VVLEWRRGTKKKSGMTDKIAVTKRESVFNHKITFTTTFFVNKKTLHYDTKRFTITLKKQVKNKIKGTYLKRMEKVEIDLGKYGKDFAGPGDPQGKPIDPQGKPITLYLDPFGKFPKAEIHLLLKAKPIKYKNHSLVPVAGNDDKNHSRMIKEVDGQDYFLEDSGSEEKSTSESATQYSENEGSDEGDEDFKSDDDEEPDNKVELFSLIQRSLVTAEKLNLLDEAIIDSLNDVIDNITCGFSPIFETIKVDDYLKQFHLQFYDVLSIKAKKDVNLLGSKKSEALVRWASCYEQELAKLGIAAFQLILMNAFLPLITKYKL